VADRTFERDAQGAGHAASSEVRGQKARPDATNS
jgi:hypothetical protein